MTSLWKRATTILAYTFYLWSKENFMRQVVLAEPFRLEMSEATEPLPTPQEALLRVRRLGICGTDLHAYQGHQPFFTYPRVLGHEISAEIVEIGANPEGFKVGDTCVVIPYLFCGKCVACRQGKTNCCISLKVLGVHVDGGMREYIAVPVHNLIRADGLTLEQMAMVENQCIGAHAVQRADLQPGETVLVIGAGPIGLGVSQFAKIRDAKVILSDLSERRLNFARQWLKPDYVVNATQDSVAHLNEITAGDFPTAVFDCTGSHQSMTNAFNYVAHGGRLVLVGLIQGEVSFNDPNFHRRETTLLSSRNATRQDFEHVIQAIAKHKAVIDPFITHHVTLDGVVGEFSHWLTPDSGVLKAMVEFR